MSNDSGRLAVISGFSGVGKGTVVRRLIEKYPYELSVSATTRPMRAGETAGISYHFVNEQKFQEMILHGDLYEWAKYVDSFYGTPKGPVEKALSEGKDVLLEIEAEGAFQVRRSRPDAMLIFMLPPSMEALVKRLRGRGSETEESVDRRLRKAQEEELEKAGQYDFLIINRDVEDCAEELHRLIQTGEGLRPSESELLRLLKEEGMKLLDR